MKTKLIVAHFRLTFRTLRFHKKILFKTLLGFTPYWDYKPTNPFTSEKYINLSTESKIHLKCDVIDGSVVNGIRELILFSFIFSKPPGY